MEEFNLSEKIIECHPETLYGEWIAMFDVKEFIKRLKEETKTILEIPLQELIEEKIGKLAGEKLVEKGR